MVISTSNHFQNMRYCQKVLIITTAGQDSYGFFYISHSCIIVLRVHRVTGSDLKIQGQNMLWYCLVLSHWMLPCKTLMATVTMNKLIMSFEVKWKCVFLLTQQHLNNQHYTAKERLRIKPLLQTASGKQQCGYNTSRVIVKWQHDHTCNLLAVHDEPKKTT